MCLNRKHYIVLGWVSTCSLLSMLSLSCACRGLLPTQKDFLLYCDQLLLLWSCHGYDVSAMERIKLQVSLVRKRLRCVWIHRLLKLVFIRFGRRVCIEFQFAVFIIHVSPYARCASPIAERHTNNARTICRPSPDATEPISARTDKNALCLRFIR